MLKWLQGCNFKCNVYDTHALNIFFTKPQRLESYSLWKRTATVPKWQARPVLQQTKFMEVCGSRPKHVLSSEKTPFLLALSSGFPTDPLEELTGKEDSRVHLCIWHLGHPLLTDNNQQVNLNKTEISAKSTI